jgi:hypothetical protein
MLARLAGIEPTTLGFGGFPLDSALFRVLHIVLWHSFVFDALEQTLYDR